MISVFKAEEIKPLSDLIIKTEPGFKQVVEQFGYPPFWHREPGFATLVLTILEQQVSLAAAASAFNRLIQKTGIITPESILSLSDNEMKACYFSRQKIIYTKHLASILAEGKLDLLELNTKPDIIVRSELIKINGIGEWTIDTYMIMSLHRSDIFPAGDLAAVKALHELKLQKADTTKAGMIRYMERFSPYRSIATCLLWHSYIQKRGLVL